MITGISGLISLAFSKNSIPSSFGILMSHNTRSYVFSPNFFKPSSPSAASSILYPSKLKISVSVFLIDFSSSIIKIVAIDIGLYGIYIKVNLTKVIGSKISNYELKNGYCFFIMFYAGNAAL